MRVYEWIICARNRVAYKSLSHISVIGFPGKYMMERATALGKTGEGFDQLLVETEIIFAAQISNPRYWIRVVYIIIYKCFISIL